MTSASLNAPLRHAAKLTEGEQIAPDALQMRALRQREIKEKKDPTDIGARARVMEEPQARG